MNRRDVRIREHSRDDPAFLALVAELDAELEARYPGEVIHGLRDDDPPGGFVLIVWVGAEAVGCCVMRPIDSNVGELKRMYVRPEFRGRGLARELLQEFETRVVSGGRRRVVLETGASQPEAIELYTSSGYRPTPCFGAYVDHGCQCYHKLLSGDTGGLVTGGDRIQLRREALASRPGLLWNAFVEFLESADPARLSPVQRVAQLAFRHDQEVTRVGHAGWASAGHDDGEEILQALRGIGATDQAELLSCLIAGREQASEPSAPPKTPASPDPQPPDFDELDRRFHRCSPGIPERLEQFLDRRLDAFVNWEDDPSV